MVNRSTEISFTIMTLESSFGCWCSLAKVFCHDYNKFSKHSPCRLSLRWLWLLVFSGATAVSHKSKPDDCRSLTFGIWSPRLLNDVEPTRSFAVHANWWENMRCKQPPSNFSLRCPLLILPLLSASVYRRPHSAIRRSTSTVWNINSQRSFKEARIADK